MKEIKIETDEVELDRFGEICNTINDTENRNLVFSLLARMLESLSTGKTAKLNIQHYSNGRITRTPF